MLELRTLAKKKETRHVRQQHKHNILALPSVTACTTAKQPLKTNISFIS